MVADIAAAELDAVHERIAGRFARAEPRARVREYLSGLVAGLERKKRWSCLFLQPPITTTAWERDQAMLMLPPGDDSSGPDDQRWCSKAAQVASAGSTGASDPLSLGH